MFNPSREQVRQFFFELWRKYQSAQTLSPLEGIGAQVARMHPEYHAVLENPGRFLERDYLPELGETNPFLHMSLHLSILEQLSIDQPPGIAEAYRALQLRHGEEHAAQHDLMACLAETVWQAQRAGAPPDSAFYLQRLREKAGLMAP